MRLRLSETANRDIERISEGTSEVYGPNGLKAYSALVEQSLGRIGADLKELGMRERQHVRDSPPPSG